jgi:elongation factor G
MKHFVRTIGSVRNIGVMAHVDAGKTTLTERILFAAGRLHKMGEVHNGAAEMDWRDLEKKHGITISAAATYCSWGGCEITIIDTPGHVDFTIEVERSLRILDSAIALFSAVSGVQPQSETVWRQADRFGAPRLCFINKMDQQGADFWRTVGEIRDRLGGRPLVAQIPIGAEAGFRGVIDLVTMTALLWETENAPPVVAPIPDALRPEAEMRRRQMIEALAETDDKALALYLEEDVHAFDETRLKALIRKACVSGQVSPVLCGSAYRNIGVQPLLDAVASYCPAPTDRPPVEGANPATGAIETREASETAPLAAMVSKVQMSRFGALTFVRVYSGRMVRGMQALNATTGKPERIGRLLRMHADKETEVDEAVAGDIIAVAGLKGTRSGDALCDPAHPILLGGFVCPEPVIEAVIEPRQAADHERLSQTLANMAREDPSLRVAVDPETGQTLVSGMGELHLAICVESLKEEHNVEAIIGAPRVAYREAITASAEVEHTLRKQNGGVGQFAKVRLRFAPAAADETGLAFENRTVGGVLPAGFVSAVEKSLRLALQEGGLAGYPVIGLRATLLDGAFHARDSSAGDFEIAARAAFKEAFMQAEPALLEPIMRVEITMPGECMGGVIGDLQARRGSVLGQDARGEGLAAVHVVEANVPLANMFGYVGALRSLSQGRAQFTMQFARYAPVPKRESAQIVAAAC